MNSSPTWQTRGQKFAKIEEPSALAIVAIRAVMREAMYVIPRHLAVPEGRRENAALAFFRSCLTSLSVRRQRSDQLVNALRSSVYFSKPRRDGDLDLASAGIVDPIDRKNILDKYWIAVSAAEAMFGGDDKLAFWSVVEEDSSNVVVSPEIEKHRLWNEFSLDKLRRYQDWVRCSENSAQEWRFWFAWFEAALDGKPLLPTWDAHWDLLEQIALIDAKTWDAGPTAVAKEIARIEATLGVRPKPPASEVIRAAVEQNRETLPAQIEALLQVLEDEAERLRGRNPTDDIEAEEIRRLRGLFENMHGVISALAKKLPDDGAPDQQSAKELAGLLSLYAGEFQKWPRENAADLVDGTCRVTLVGLTAGLFAAFGAPWLAGVAAGGLLFGGKRLADIKNAAKGLGDSVGPPVS